MMTIEIRFMGGVHSMIPVIPILFFLGGGNFIYDFVELVFFP